MLGPFLLRLARLLSVLLAVTAVTYFLLYNLPGDPTVALLGPAAGDKAAASQLRQEMHLDESFSKQYTAWLGNAVHGDLGKSYFENRPVTSAIGDRLPLTLELMVLSEVLAIAIAVPVGVWAARRPGGLFDRISGGALFSLLALPAFMIGVLLIYAFAVKIQALPATGIATWFKVGNAPVATPLSILLPIITLASGQLAVFARLLRSEMIITLRSDFIMVAKAKGLPERRILLRHALRPSSFSLVTVVGISVAALMGGTIIVERMFALPGMGQLIVTAIYKRDYLIVQGGVVLVAVAFVMANFLVDLLYALLDPRVRTGARST